MIFHDVYKSLKPYPMLFFSSKPSWNVAVFTEKNQRKGIIIMGQVLSVKQPQVLGSSSAWASVVSMRSQILEVCQKGT